MYRFADLTDEQILALTEADIQRWVDIECAHRGVPLLPAMPEFQQEMTPEPDIVVYKIGDVGFIDPADAARVIQEYQSTPLISIDWGGSSDRKVARPMNESHYHYPKIETVKCFSPALWDRVQTGIRAADIRKKEFETAKADYDRVVNSRQSVADDVFERIDEVNKKNRRRQTLESLLERYIGLAGGDRHVALAFLENAEPTARTEHPELFADA